MTQFGPLYDIDHGSALVGYVAGAGLAVLVRGVVQARLGAALGDDSGVRAGRGAPDLRKHMDIYAAVAWVLHGFTWGHSLSLGWRASKRNRVILSLSGPVTLFLLAVGETAVFKAAGGHLVRISGVLLYGGDAGASPRLLQLLFAAIITTGGMAVLACVPLPPLDGWTFLRAVTRVTPGMERARYQLEERNIGLAITFAIVVIPLLIPSLDPLYALATRVAELAQTVVGG